MIPNNTREIQMANIHVSHRRVLALVKGRTNQEHTKGLGETYDGWYSGIGHGGHRDKSRWW